MEFVKDLKRSHYCSDLRASDEGSEVVLMGWVATRRDHGGLVFIDLRDRTGIVQVVFDPQNDATQSAKDFRNEFVVAVKGKVKRRPDGMTNNKIDTGDVEVEALETSILSSATTPPFQVDDEKVSENLRLKYRYLELRSPQVQRHLFLRHRVLQLSRNHLTEQGFIEVETPILYKSTPEGARDYLVPSRVHKGNFYALPQSPQTLKQLLMIGGFDKYFQIARCFRDEDLRADRQPEFSQIDIEMSFVNQDDVMVAVESLVKMLWKEVLDKDLEKIPVMTYHEAMNTYGVDNPDIRIPWKLYDLNEVVGGSGFKVFDDVVDRGGSIKGLAVPGLGSASRGQLDKLTASAKQMGAKGMVWIKNKEGEFSSSVSKFFDKDQLQKIFETCQGEKEGGVLIVADDWNVTCAALGHLRAHLAHEMDAIDKTEDKFVWITDFPLFEYDAEEKRWVAKHHPFTQPNNEGRQVLLDGDSKNYHALKAEAYDLVCNGHEIVGGSIRIHDQKIQKRLFEALGMSEKEVQTKFGFFNEALTYGTPPHGGAAWGFDRMVMILSRTEAIRDVIAFPKTTKASCQMSEAPSEVDQDQLLELGIRLAPSVENKG